MSLMEHNNGQAAPKGAPDPELVERPRRRRFSAEYKLRVLHEAEASSRPGEIGALLRREGLYTSHLTAWRKQRDRGALKALSRPRGRKPADPRDAQIAGLRRRAERAEAETPAEPGSSRSELAAAGLRMARWNANAPALL